MSKKRARIVMMFDVDLDWVPGPYHQVSDHIKFIERSFMPSFAHYNAKVEVLSIEELNYSYSDGKGWVMPEFKDISVSYSYKE